MAYLSCFETVYPGLDRFASLLSMFVWPKITDDKKFPQLHRTNTSVLRIVALFKVVNLTYTAANLFDRHKRASLHTKQNDITPFCTGGRVNINLAWILDIVTDTGAS